MLAWWLQIPSLSWMWHSIDGNFTGNTRDIKSLKFVWKFKFSSYNHFFVRAQWVNLICLCDIYLYMWHICIAFISIYPLTASSPKPPMDHAYEQSTFAQTEHFGKESNYWLRLNKPNGICIILTPICQKKWQQITSVVWGHCYWPSANSKMSLTCSFQPDFDMSHLEMAMSQLFRNCNRIQKNINFWATYQAQLP